MSSPVADSPSLLTHHPRVQVCGTSFCRRPTHQRVRSLRQDICNLSRGRRFAIKLQTQKIVSVLRASRISPVEFLRPRPPKSRQGKSNRITVDVRRIAQPPKIKLLNSPNVAGLERLPICVLPPAISSHPSKGSRNPPLPKRNAHVESGLISSSTLRANLPSTRKPQPTRKKMEYKRQRGQSSQGPRKLKKEREAQLRKKNRGISAFMAVPRGKS